MLGKLKSKSILTRFKEHLAQIRYGRPDCIDHCIDLNNLKLIKQVSNYRQLDAYESIRINKCKDRMNRRQRSNYFQFSVPTTLVCHAGILIVTKASELINVKIG